MNNVIRVCWLFSFDFPLKNKVSVQWLEIQTSSVLILINSLDLFIYDSLNNFHALLVFKVFWIQFLNGSWNGSSDFCHGLNSVQQLFIDFKSEMLMVKLVQCKTHNIYQNFFSSYRCLMNIKVSRVTCWRLCRDLRIIKDTASLICDLSADLFPISITIRHQRSL
jgi:hypothetical protein